MDRVTGAKPKSGVKHNAMDPATAGPKESGPRGGGVPRERPHSAGVGNEKKADMAGAQSRIGDTGLSGAVKELHKQHPIPYHDHGPHHGTTHHVRHEPLHGLKGKAGY